MRLLLRMTFWLGVVIVLLPNPPLRPGALEPSTSGTQAAVPKTASADTGRICPRQLDACCSGFQAFAKLCRNLHQFLTERGAQRRSKSAGDTAGASQNTLTPTDLVMPWRGSAPRKEPGARRSI